MGTKKKYPEPYRREGSDSYYFTFTEPDGRRRIRSTGETRKERARDVIREIMDRQRSNSSDLSFSEYAAPYFMPETCPHFARLREEGRSIGLTHLANCRYHLEKHVLTDKAFSAIPIAEIRRADLLDLRKRLRAAGVGSNTVNKALSSVKTILAEAYHRQEIEDNVGARVGEIKYAKQERGVLLPAEVAALLAYLTERTALMQEKGAGAQPVKKGASTARAAINASLAIRDEAMVAFLLCTGVRAGELRALRWRAVNLKTGRCIIDEALKGLDGLGRPKWGKTREIVIPALALSRLKAWHSHIKEALEEDPPEENPVFGDVDGAPIGYEGAHNVFEKILEEARDKERLPRDDRWLSPHSCRHSLNTNLLAAGVAPLLVQSFLGWSSAEAKVLTRVQSAYTHLQLLRIEDVAETIDSIYGQVKASKRKKNIA